jgi:hypothetical protein
VTGNAPVTILSPDSGGDATQPGGEATAAPPADGGSGGDQDAGESTGALQIGTFGVTPGFDADAPLTANTPITILSPGSGGDATGPGGTPPGDGGGDTPTDPDGDTPTGPDGTPPQGSPPPGTGDDDGSAGGGGGAGGPGPGLPDRGTQGEFAPNPGSPSTTARREFGAFAGDLPFTGLLLWLLALAGMLSMALGAKGRQLSAR